MNLLVDFINPQQSRGFTTRLDKINFNIGLIQPLKDNISKQIKEKKNAFSAMTIIGRWIVIYQANIDNDDDTIMHFIDFRIDMADPINSEIFSQNTLNNIFTLQDRYDQVFQPKYDTAELSFAEPFEKIIKPNFFACDNDSIVLEKAKTLGVMPMIESLHGDDKIKVVIADELITVDNVKITNIYAIIHFGGHSNENVADNGFGYLKIYDLLENRDRIVDFEQAIKNVGGKFDRQYIMERFNIPKLN